MIKKLIIYFSILFLFGCENPNYQPDNLKKISKDELKDLIISGNLSINDSTKYYNQSGELIPIDSVRKIPDLKEKWFLDFYKNRDNKIEEIVVRKIKVDEIEWREKLQEEIKNKNISKVDLVDIECSKLGEILDKVYEDDQNMRNNGDIDSDIDQQNLNIVASILEQCGMPTLNEVNSKQISAIWLVIQHADKTIRKKCFPILKKAAQNGDLNKRDIAMMEDRMLMDEDKPQIYGTQVVKNSSSDPWKLYKLKDPERVDIRRSEIGFEPLNQYLEHFDIDFKIKQEQ